MTGGSYVLNDGIVFCDTTIKYLRHYIGERQVFIKKVYFFPYTSTTMKKYPFSEEV